MNIRNFAFFMVLFGCTLSFAMEGPHAGGDGLGTEENEDNEDNGTTYRVDDSPEIDVELLAATWRGAIGELKSSPQFSNNMDNKTRDAMFITAMNKRNMPMLTFLADRLLKENDSPSRLLEVALNLKYMDAAKLFLRRRAQQAHLQHFTAMGSWLETPRKKEMMILLINKATNFGGSLDWAIYNNHRDVVELLINCGVDIDTVIEIIKEKIGFAVHFPSGDKNDNVQNLKEMLAFFEQKQGAGADKSDELINLLGFKDSSAYLDDSCLTQIRNSGENVDIDFVKKIKGMIEARKPIDEITGLITGKNPSQDTKNILVCVGMLYKKKDMLDFLINNAAVDPQEVFRVSLTMLNMEMAEYLVKQKGATIPKELVQALLAMFRNETDDPREMSKCKTVLTFLTRHNTSQSDLLEVSIKNNDGKMLEWLIRNGYTDKEKALKVAQEILSGDLANSVSTPAVGEAIKFLKQLKIQQPPVSTPQTPTISKNPMIFALAAGVGAACIAGVVKVMYVSSAIKKAKQLMAGTVSTGSTAEQIKILTSYLAHAKSSWKKWLFGITNDSVAQAQQEVERLTA